MRPRRRITGMSTLRLAALAATVVAAIAAAFALRPVPAHGDAAPVSEQGVVAVGTGSATSVPDTGSFSFTVTSPAATAVAASRAEAAAMAAVVAAVKKAGVAAADVRTSLVSLDQRRSPDGSSVTGYTASSTIDVLVRRLASAAAIVDAAVAAGADGFSGPGLAAADSSALYATALDRAVADARAKAQRLAAAAGLTLGRVTGVTEGGAQPVPFAASAKDSVAIEPGTLDIQATVTVTFAAS
jgi:uncharacterized protein YggE